MKRWLLIVHYMSGTGRLRIIRHIGFPFRWLGILVGNCMLAMNTSDVPEIVAYEVVDSHTYEASERLQGRWHL